MKTAASVLLSVLGAACASNQAASGPRATSPAPRSDAVSATTASRVEANWKERLAQPYVFVEHSGDYRQMGDAMRTLFAAVDQAGIEATGAPFALFFDDPGRVPTAELRARACMPVRDEPSGLGELHYDVLPRAMVAYARVAGAYSDVARSYPALFSYVRELGWQPEGPIREVYLVNPASASRFDELETEVQVPWRAPER